MFLIIGVIGGGVAGGIAGANAGDPALASEAGRDAGLKFWENYGLWVFLGSAVFAGLIAVVVGFSGLFPWCRRSSEGE